MGKSQRKQEEYVVATRSIRMNEDDVPLVTATAAAATELHCTALHCTALALALFWDSVQLLSHKAIFLVIY
jgi:hypothetical protein